MMATERVRVWEHVTPKGKKRYKCRYEDANGDQHWVGTFDDHDKAMQEGLRVKELDRRGLLEKKRGEKKIETFGQLAEEFLKVKGPGYQPGTLYHFHYAIRDANEVFGDRELRKFTVREADMLLNHFRQKGYKASTAKQWWRDVRTILRAGMAYGYVHSDPWPSHLFKPSFDSLAPSRERVCLDKEADYPKLKNALPDWYRPLLDFFIFSGLRQSECFGVKFGAIDWEARGVWVRGQLIEGKEKDRTKNKYSRRLVSLGETAMGALSEQRKQMFKKGFPCGQEDLVWLTPNGKRHSHNSSFLQNILPRALKDAGITETVTLHDLRHTFASWSFLATGDLAAVAEQMGHADTTMLTTKYLHRVLRKESLGDALDTFVKTPSSPRKEKKNA